MIVVDKRDKEKAFVMEVFDQFFTYDGVSTSASKRKNFKPKLAKIYLNIEQRDLKLTSDLTCQILHIDLPKFIVIGAHLFKREWGPIMAKALLKINQVDNPRNGLLLFAPIAKAFDRSRLCFLKSQNSDDFYLHLLDPSLRDVALFDSCLPFINKKECEFYGKSVDEVKAMLEEKLKINKRSITFRDLEGRSILCRGETTPYKRCLDFQASRARDYAIKQNWISKDVVFKYSWSQEFDSEKINSYLNTLGPMDSLEEFNSEVQENASSGEDDVRPEDVVDDDEEGDSADDGESDNDSIES